MRSCYHTNTMYHQVPLGAVKRILNKNGRKEHTMNKQGICSVGAAVFFICAVPFIGCDCTDTQYGQAKAVLDDLVSRTEHYIGNEQTALENIAQSDAAMTGVWDEIKPMLIAGTDGNVEALGWYALPDGSYWTTQQDGVDKNLSDRAYWPDLMQGNTVDGALVVSKSTEKPSAVFAVPVVQGETVTGVVAYSIFLDSMTLQLQEELNMPDGMIFFILNEDAINVGDSSDIGLIFDEPLEQTDYPALQQAVQEIMAGADGSVAYDWLGAEKRAVYRLSTSLGWRFVVAYVVSG